MLENIVIISLLIFGIKIACGEGMLLHKQYLYWKSIAEGKRYYEPTINCIYCMSSFYTIIYYIMEMLIYNSYVSLGIILLTIPAVCGLNHILHTIAPIEEE